VHKITLWLSQVGKGNLGMSTDSPEVIITGVDGDPAKPWREWGPRSKPLDSQVRFQKDVLGQVFHVLLASEKAADDGTHMPIMQPEQGLEGFLVAFLRLPDEMGFSL
jgi:hypothetical protein